MPPLTFVMQSLCTWVAMVLTFTAFCNAVLVEFRMEIVSKVGWRAKPHKNDPVAPILPPPCQCRGEVSLQNRIALHGGVAATLTPIALRCATKYRNASQEADPGKCGKIILRIIPHRQSGVIFPAGWRVPKLLSWAWGTYECQPLRVLQSTIPCGRSHVQFHFPEFRS